MELAPLLASVCTICKEKMPTESALGTVSWGLATASVAADCTNGPTVYLSPLHLHPVKPHKDVGPV